MKKGILFLLGFMLTFNFGYGQQKKFQISLLGMLSHILQYGSEDEYMRGENDFPVTPAHTVLGFGAELAYFFRENMAIEGEVRYILSSEVTLVDPSDQDSVKVDTPRRITATLNFIHHFFDGKIRPYLVIGGGIDILLAEDETYISEYGYEVDLLAPEKKVDPVAQAGGGILYFFNPRAGAKLDFRYSLIFDKPNHINNINLAFGFFLRF